MSETNELGNTQITDDAASNNAALDGGANDDGADEDLNKSSQGADGGADDDGNKGNDDAGIYGAPETYNYEAIKLPKGYEYDKEMLKEFDALNKQTNLSQAQANKYMEFGLKLAQKQAENLPAILKQVQQTKITQFQQALNTDKEIGGGDRTKMNAYLDVADKGYTAFANDEVKAALADAGLNYHPAIVKMFHRIGELVGDDKIFNPKTPSGASTDVADVLYGSNN
jgi:hypothetical protein